MRTAPSVLLIGCLVISLSLQTGSAQKSASKGVARPGPTSTDFQGVKTLADIANFASVNKRCRLWGADGDIDVDQTCLVVRTVGGKLVVIPNEYNDAEAKELTDELGRQNNDKWLQRFYSIKPLGQTRR
jgi:hypothetical protein